MVNVIKPSFVTHEDDKSRPLSILSTDISPDGARLATGGLDQKIKIWNTGPILSEQLEEDPETKKLLSTLGAHTGNVLCVRWSPSGVYLASGSDDNIVIVWEKDEGGFGRKVFGQAEENYEVWKAAGRLVGHDSDVSSLAWSGDGYYLATGGSDTRIMIWETEGFTRVRTLTYHQGFVKGLAFDPVGELLASQSDDQSVCIWKTTDWSMVSKVEEPFRNSPNASWFRRLSWSPEGTLLAVPNSVNNGVFVAGIMTRKDWGAATSLCGHDSVIDVTCFSPISFVKDPSKPATGSNLCSVLAVAARSCISIWLTSQVRPIVVFDTIVDRDTLDLAWSSDGTNLYACSSEGHIAVIQFQLEELGHPAPTGAQEQHKATWGFKAPPRSGTGAFGQAGRAVSAGGPNILTARPKNKPKQVVPLLPIPPPGAPQKITILAGGKRRIQPTHLGLGDIIPQPLNTGFNRPVAASQLDQQNLQPAFEHRFQAPNMPSPNFGGDVDMLDSSMQAYRSGNQGAPTRTPLQGIGTPSWGAPQDQPVQYAQASARKRRAAEMDYDDDQAGPSLAVVRPPGRTLGGDRPATLPYTGKSVELRPAYIPTTIVQVPEETLGLAVPAVHAYQSFKWDTESDDAETLEIRNFAQVTRPSEISQSNAVGKVQWLDYVPGAIVQATFSPTFSAISCDDNTLNVYSASGRRIMPTIMLDGPCSFMDSAEDYLLTLTCKGTLTVWDVRRRLSKFKPASVYPLLSQGPTSVGNPPIINATKVRSNGCPILSLSNGLSVTFDPDLSSWVHLSSTWWSKGSEYWEGRIRSNTSAGRGPIKILESETNDYMGAQPESASLDGEEARLRPSLEGQEQKKLGNDDDWKMALTLGHLESRMSAAIALDSLAEYKMFLSLYAKRLAEEAFRGKAEELVRDLIGPIYHKPGREETWSPTLLGVSKHSLLKEVLSVFARSKTFTKLANDTNDILKKMASDV